MFKKALNNEFSKAKSLFFPAGINNTPTPNRLRDVITGYAYSNATDFTISGDGMRSATGSAYVEGNNPTLTGMWFAAAWGTLVCTDGANVNSWGWGNLASGPSISLPLGVSAARRGFVSTDASNYHELPTLTELGFVLTDSLTLVAALVDLTNNKSWQYAYKTSLVSAETPSNSKIGTALPASFAIGTTAHAGCLLTNASSLAKGAMIGTVSSQAEAEVIFTNLAAGKLKAW